VAAVIFTHAVIPLKLTFQLEPAEVFGKQQCSAGNQTFHGKIDQGRMVVLNGPVLSARAVGIRRRIDKNDVKTVLGFPSGRQTHLI
jgi:hypothetical protein